MNTTLAFAFGMLAMVAIIMIVVIVVGMVKVIKLEKQHKELDRASAKEGEFIHRRITDVERSVYSEISETRNRFDSLAEELRRELYSYTDSRVDKALGTIGSKQILKD
jgi:hypothetical protein